MISLSAVIRRYPDFYAETPGETKPQRDCIEHEIKNRTGIDRVEKILGTGVFAVAAAINDDLVLKLTGDESDYLSTRLLIRKSLSNVVRVFSAFKIVCQDTDFGDRDPEDIDPELDVFDPVFVVVSERVPRIGLGSFRRDEILDALSDTAKNKFDLESDSPRSHFEKAARFLIGNLSKMEWPFSEVADGMAQLYRLGIYTADVHPGNVGIAKNGKIKIFDFGFSSVPHRR